MDPRTHSKLPTLFSTRLMPVGGGRFVRPGRHALRSCVASLSTAPTLAGSFWTPLWHKLPTRPTVNPKKPGVCIEGPLRHPPEGEARAYATDYAPASRRARRTLGDGRSLRPFAPACRPGGKGKPAGSPLRRVGRNIRIKKALPRVPIRQLFRKKHNFTASVLQDWKTTTKRTMSSRKA